jgi:hypothetical protein
MNMKTSKLFYSLALASLVSLTASADNTPASQPSGNNNGSTTAPTLQNNLIIQGSRSDSDSHGPRPAPRPITPPDKHPTPPVNNTGNGNVNT